MTSAVLLDAKTHVGKGQPMKAGEVVTAAHIDAMLKAQGLTRRGILPGDVVYIRTGWGNQGALVSAVDVARSRGVPVE